MSEQISPYGRPSGYQGRDPQAPAVARPWFKKKRFLIPLALVLLFIVAGIAGGSSDPKDDTVAIGASPTATAATAAPVQPTQDPAAAAEKAAAEKAAADKAAVDKAVADKAAADKAAADKVAAEEGRRGQGCSGRHGLAAQAVRKAESYLDFTPFSRSGLIKQVQFDGFSAADATYAVDHITVDYNEQAAKKAKSYLDFTSFSRSGLIKQLQFDGFTAAQATYGTEQAGL